MELFPQMGEFVEKRAVEKKGRTLFELRHGAEKTWKEMQR